MKILYWVSGISLLLILSGVREGFLIFLVLLPIFALIYKNVISPLFKGTNRIVSNTVSNKLAERRDEKEWNKNLNREAQRERVLGKARNEAQIELMREQANNLIMQQNAGLHVERELMGMREKLLNYQNNEFDDLINKINTHL